MSEEEFVTVVSVEDAPFVTVVDVEEPSIGIAGVEDGSLEPPVEEEIQLYRLPGERLGFGLKFDGGPVVLGLTIESTAEGSPSARAKASWGPLGPGDSILAVDGKPVAGMTRQEVVGRLTEFGLVVRLLVRRGPPPVPPRRQARRRLPGPPPPPRPLPRAPPRLVDFLPKDSTICVIDQLPEDPSIVRCTIPENSHTIEINGGQGFICKQEVMESPSINLNLDDTLKEKISPLKNLNPKLISLFEHSPPADTNNKTSQINCKLWKNDDKGRKSVKDKIALFSNESNNNDENKAKPQENSDVIQTENQERKKSKKIKAAPPNQKSYAESNKHYLCSKINITKNADITDVSNQNIEKLICKINAKSNNKKDDDYVTLDLPNNTYHDEFITPKEALTVPINEVNDLHPLFPSKEDKHSLFSEEVNPQRPGIGKCGILDNLIDHKKKSSNIKEKIASKLRGLIIPQNISRVSTADQILDLPEIKSTNVFPDIINTQNTILKNQSYEKNALAKQTSIPSSLNTNSNGSTSSTFDWKPKIDQEIPKYSPAFKRKALSVFEIRTQFPSPLSEEIDYENVNKKPDEFCELLIVSSESDDLEVPKFDKKHLRSHETPASSLEYESNEKLFEFLPTELAQCGPHPSLNEGNLLSNIDKDENKSDSNTLSCISNTSKNHSKTSSLTSDTTVSHCSGYSNNADIEKMKDPLDGKLDSLLSQDMSDSGNHSIPSNYSKSKYDSCDESMCFLVNGEIQDSDDLSLNSSSDEGQFIEFNYKNNNVMNSLCSDQSSEQNSSVRANKHSLFSESITNDYIKPSKDHNYDSIKSANSECEIDCKTTCQELEETINSENEIIIIKDNNNIIKDIEPQEEQPYLLQNSSEEKEKSEGATVFRISHCNKINRMRNMGLKNNTDGPPAFSLKEHSEDLSILNNPICDLQKENHFASITSLASSTSLISQQELCQLIEESNNSSIEDSNGSQEISVIVLHRDSAEGSIGITLAGGVDYESKDITVHKVLSGSPADRDGRIKKGHRILSINGKSMKGLTHSESLTVLKAPRHEVVLVVARTQGELFEENNNNTRNSLCHSKDTDYVSSFPNNTACDNKWGSVINISLKKEGAGLGFSLKGGKDSPCGDQPLTVQKIFTGGCADKSGQIFAGDELLSIDNYDMNDMTRVEAWTLMKRLPDGEVLIKIRHPAHFTSETRYQSSLQ